MNEAMNYSVQPYIFFFTFEASIKVSEWSFEWLLSRHHTIKKNNSSNKVHNLKIVIHGIIILLEPK